MCYQRARSQLSVDLIVFMKTFHPHTGGSKQKGFTLLYAMVVISIVLTLSAGIMTIMVKELKLSGYGRESQIAYYAAESGAECALYWIALGTLDGSKTGDIRCADKDINGVSSQFTVDLSPYPGCADVTVIAGTPIIVESRGYNTCAPSKLRVERGIKVTY